MESTTEGDSGFAVPVGNTTMVDPAKSGKAEGKVQPLPAAPPPQAKPSYEPVSATQVASEPDIDATGCGRAVQYPAEAEQLGIEGQVLLRIELEESGQVHAIKVLKGLGHGLDEAAVRAMKSRAECRFKPARGRDGKPKAYIVERYVFNFELPR
jgi:protein TonB